MNDNNNMRLIFRPTKEQYKRIQQIYNQGRYKHISELLRHALNIGLDQMEEKTK